MQNACGQSVEAGPSYEDVREAFLRHAATLTSIAGVYGNVEGGSYKVYEVENSTDIQEPKRRNLFELARTARYVVEIGFNTGHSTLLYLMANDRCRVWAFDLGEHPYVWSCYRYLQDQFHNRVTLVLGNSLHTLPEFSLHKVGVDLFHVDGGHQLEVATSDMNNCRRLAHDGSFIVLDDAEMIKELGNLWEEWIRREYIRGVAQTAQTRMHAVGAFNKHASDQP